MKQKTQEQLDKLVRAAANHQAIEEMVHEDQHFQQYSISDGSMIKINKFTGDILHFTQPKLVKYNPKLSTFDGTKTTKGGKNKMMGASYPTKKALKAAVGTKLKYVETSAFGPEYKATGVFTVVGPDAYTSRKWFARVETRDDIIISVR